MMKQTDCHSSNTRFISSSIVYYYISNLSLRIWKIQRPSLQEIWKKESQLGQSEYLLAIFTMCTVIHALSIINTQIYSAHCITNCQHCYVNTQSDLFFLFSYCVLLYYYRLNCILVYKRANFIIVLSIIAARNNLAFCFVAVKQKTQTWISLRFYFEDSLFECFWLTQEWTSCPGKDLRFLLVFLYFSEHMLLFLAIFLSHCQTSTVSLAKILCRYYQF